MSRALYNEVYHRPIKSKHTNIYLKSHNSIVMARNLALVIILYLFLIFLHFSTSCLGAPRRTTNPVSDAIADQITDQITDQLRKTLKKQFQKNNENNDTANGEVPQSSGTYEVSFTIGTPPQNATAILEIASGFIWTQCKTCDVCLNQTTPLYNPQSSSTYSNFSSPNCNSTNSNYRDVCDYIGITPDACPDDSCYYARNYYQGQNSSGLYATDNFTFGSTSVSDIVFGCGLENYGDYDNSSGILNLGWGPLSLVSQARIMRFSYCLSSDQRKKSTVNFGSHAKLQGPGQSTPLIRNHRYPNWYYVGLANITVGTTLLDIPSSTFKIREDGTGGVYLLTNEWPLTYFEVAAYDLVKQAIVSMMNQTTVDGSDLGLDLCYKNVTKWPTLTLHFDGGATLKLKTVNYVYKDADTGRQCLAILSWKGESSLGSLIMMDTNFVYDLENKTISFERCFSDSTSSVISNIPHLITTMALFLFCMLKFF
ncbi:hypothetical protein LUZ60_001370 [Juncus effusus]|nr:hypothetical protein LUZ60_001370 [Juncus effusus]